MQIVTVRNDGGGDCGCLPIIQAVDNCRGLSTAVLRVIVVKYFLFVLTN